MGGGGGVGWVELRGLDEIGVQISKWRRAGGVVLRAGGCGGGGNSEVKP